MENRWHDRIIYYYVYRTETRCGESKTLSLFFFFFLNVRSKIWVRNDLTRPFRCLSPPNSPPNSPGFHHCLRLYSNKEQRRRQQFLFSILLMVRWLLTKSNFKIKHTSNAVISKTNKGFVEGDLKSRSEVFARLLDLSRQITRRR